MYVACWSREVLDVETDPGADTCVAVAPPQLLSHEEDALALL